MAAAHAPADFHFAGRAARPIPPLAETVAAGIVRCAESPKREVTYARAGRALEFAHAVAPGLYSCFLLPAFEAGNYADRPTAPTAGTVLNATDGPYASDGGWKRHRRRESFAPSGTPSAAWRAGRGAAAFLDEALGYTDRGILVGIRFARAGTVGRGDCALGEFV